MGAEAHGVVAANFLFWINCLSDLFEPGAKRIVQQVGVAQRGLDLSVAEELADHWQRHAARNQQPREGVAKAVDADAGPIGQCPDIVPEAL